MYRSSNLLSTTFQKATRHHVRGSINTLTDLMMLMGLILGMGVGICVIYPKVQASSRAQTVADQLNTIARKADTALVSRWDTNAAVNAGMFPQDWLPAGHGPVDPWGHPVTLVTVPGGDGVQVTLEKLPSPDCVAMMRHVPEAWNEVRIDQRLFTSDAARTTACLVNENVPKTVSFVHHPGQRGPLLPPSSQATAPHPET